MMFKTGETKLTWSSISTLTYILFHDLFPKILSTTLEKLFSQTSTSQWIRYAGEY